MSTKTKTTRPRRNDAGLVGYIRVSRRGGRDGETYLSPTLQREAIERWSEYENVRITAWEVDEDWSGGASSRPGLDRAREMIRSGEASGLVAWKVDRFSRNTRQGLDDLELFQSRNARLAFVTERIDTDTPHGKLVYTIMLAMAEAYLDTISTGWEAAQRKAFARGAYIGPTPLGYVRVADRLDPRAGALDIDRRVGPRITRAFEIGAADGLDAARRYLAKTFRNRRWETTDARRLLANRAYLGEVILDTDDGRQTRVAHEPLTDPETFALAQTKSRTRRSNGDYPLTGIAVCGVCGEPMTGGLQSFTNRAATYRRYRCSARGCGRSSISADKLEAHVREQLVDALGVQAFAAKLSPEGLTAAREQLAAAERALIRWTADDRTRDAIGESAYFAGLDERREAVESARVAYDELAAVAASVEVLPTADELEDPEQFARALRLAVDSVVVSAATRSRSITGRVSPIRWQRHDLVAGMLAA
jgi:DNA invertase Pin-like site-specific DNA recombinase